MIVKTRDGTVLFTTRRTEANLSFFKTVKEKVELNNEIMQIIKNTILFAFIHFFSLISNNLCRISKKIYSEIFSTSKFSHRNFFMSIR